LLFFVAFCGGAPKRCDFLESCAKAQHVRWASSTERWSPHRALGTQLVASP